jgi:hypothetical protein
VRSSATPKKLVKVPVFNSLALPARLAKIKTKIIINSACLQYELEWKQIKRLAGTCNFVFENSS